MRRGRRRPLPGELDLHALRHSYVTHLVEFDYPERFVQDQVGHAYASTTAIYPLGVSDEYRNRLLERSLKNRYGEFGRATRDQEDGHPLASADADGREGHVPDQRPREASPRTAQFRSSGRAELTAGSSSDRRDVC
jgi:Phage integrase family